MTVSDDLSPDLHQAAAGFMTPRPRHVGHKIAVPLFTQAIHQVGKTDFSWLPSPSRAAYGRSREVLDSIIVGNRARVGSELTEFYVSLGIVGILR